MAVGDWRSAAKLEATARAVPTERDALGFLRVAWLKPEILVRRGVLIGFGRAEKGRVLLEEDEER